MESFEERCKRYEVNGNLMEFLDSIARFIRKSEKNNNDINVKIDKVLSLVRNNEKDNHRLELAFAETLPETKMRRNISNGFWGAVIMILVSVVTFTITKAIETNRKSKIEQVEKINPK